MYHAARIVAKQSASPTVTILRLHSPSLPTFRPGQWIDFTVPGRDWIGGFSLSSCPTELPLLEIAVKSARHAPAQWVRDESNIDDYVQIQVGGSCVLVLSSSSSSSVTALNRPTYFCAGGIGVSPLLSMYRQHVQERERAEQVQTNQKESNHNIHNHNDRNHENQSRTEFPKASFYYSVRHHNEIVYGKELRELAARHGDDLNVFVTRADSAHNSNGSEEVKDVAIPLTAGTKADIVVAAAAATHSANPQNTHCGRERLRHFLEKSTETVGSNLSPLYYLCGPPSMQDDAIAILQSRGVADNSIIYERWW